MLKGAAAAGDRIRRPDDGVVVLLYHRVGARTRTEIDLPAATFDRQMAWLAASGRAVSLDRALNLVATRAPDGETPTAARSRTPDRPVVVTFDDGTADLADVALPILVRHGIPATVYLATRYTDEGLPWPAGGQPLSWTAAAEMLDSGLVSFGSHTHSHALLDRLPPGQAAEELERSQELIQDHLQVPAEHFAYPKAVTPSPHVEAEVRARFRSAALGGSRPNPYGRTDRFRLARTAVQVSDGTTFFRHKAEGGMALEDTARRAANRVRYRNIVD